jgi:MoaA/NifB/PqqE/SkfB family radical SAM enzyme
LCPFDVNEADLSSRFALWEITGVCQSKCQHCLRGGSSRAHYSGSIDETIGFLQRNGFGEVLLSGGDPLLFPGIVKLMARLVSEGLRVGSYVNAALVTGAQTAELRRVGLAYAILSLDGASAATHDAVRGNGNFEKTQAAVRALVQAGIEVDLTYTVGSHNFDGHARIVSIAQEWGATAVTIVPTLPIGNAQGLTDDFGFDLEAAGRIGRAIAENMDNAVSNSGVQVERIRFPLPGELPAQVRQCPRASLVYIDCEGAVGTCPWLGSMKLGLSADPNLDMEGRYRSALAQHRRVEKERSVAGCHLAAYLHTGKLAGEDPFVATARESNNGQ